MFLFAGIILGFPFPRTNRYDNSFFPFSISNWNNLDSNIKSSSSLRGLATFHFPGGGGGGFLCRYEKYFLAAKSAVSYRNRSVRLVCLCWSHTTCEPRNDSREKKESHKASQPRNSVPHGVVVVVVHARWSVTVSGVPLSVGLSVCLSVLPLSWTVC